MLFMMLWYLMGLCGCFLFWYGEARFDAYLGKRYGQRPAFITWCPTPRAILGYVVFSWLGPVAVVGGLISYTVSWDMIGSDGKRGNFRRWFTTPICKSKS